MGEPRTGWDHRKNGYALGELAAEIASCYVAAELGIPQGEGLGNHAAYLKNWLEALRNDRNYIFKAAKQATKVTDFLLDFVRKPEPEAVGAVPMSETIVIFRKDRTGEDASPSSPSCRPTSSGTLCTAYQHVGQHCAADYDLCISHSDPATPAEYADLFEELERRGYILSVRREPRPRCTNAVAGSQSGVRRTNNQPPYRNSGMLPEDTDERPTETIRRQQLAEVNAELAAGRRWKPSTGRCGTRSSWARTSPSKASWHRMS